MVVVHRNSSLNTEGIDDAETLAFCRDLHAVSVTVHQGMVIGGPWMEARMKAIMRSWLPQGWLVSGPAQIYRPDKPGIRSRSWDIVVHREPLTDTWLPPIASPESGYPLLPTDVVAAVVDTKTNFSNPREYAEQSVFNLMNDATENQLAFLGSQIVKMILVASSSKSPDSMLKAGKAYGLNAFSLGRYRASPVLDGERRVTTWRLERLGDGQYPLQAFKAVLAEAVQRNPMIYDGRSAPQD